MNAQYEVLNPWADVDPGALKGITPRVTDLMGKTVGLFCNNKVAAPPVLAAVEKRLKERFPTLKFSPFRFYQPAVYEVTLSKHKARFEEWLKGVDTVVAAVGD